MLTFEGQQFLGTQQVRRWRVPPQSVGGAPRSLLLVWA